MNAAKVTVLERPFSNFRNMVRDISFFKIFTTSKCLVSYQFDRIGQYNNPKCSVSGKSIASHLVGTRRNLHDIWRFYFLDAMGNGIFQLLPVRCFEHRFAFVCLHIICS